MAFVALRAVVAELQKSRRPPEGATLQDCMYDRWHQGVLTELSGILNAPSDAAAASDALPDDETVSARCHQFLRSRGDLVRFYTAYPHSEITALIIQLATEISDEEHSPLSLMVPGVAQTSFDDRYPDLGKIDIKQLLRTHTLSIECTYLHPVAMLCTLSVTDELAPPFNAYYDHRRGVTGAKLTAAGLSP